MMIAVMATAVITGMIILKVFIVILIHGDNSTGSNGSSKW